MSDGSRDPATLERVGGADPTDLIATIRGAVAEGRRVLVAPDPLAADHDEWIALAAAALVEGAQAIETRHRRDARRLLDVRTAIVTGGEGIEW